MRDEVAPLALLFVALGLALALAPPSARTCALLALVASTAAVASLPFTRAMQEYAFWACWLSVIATAASVHLARGLSPSLAVLLSLTTGICAGALISLSPARSELHCAWPCLLIMWPASWVARRYSTVPLKVVSSWVIAVAALALTLKLLPVTPGYLPDHSE